MMENISVNIKPQRSGCPWSPLHQVKIIHDPTVSFGLKLGYRSGPDHFFSKLWQTHCKFQMRTNSHSQDKRSLFGTLSTPGTRRNCLSERVKRDPVGTFLSSRGQNLIADVSAQSPRLASND